MNRLAIFAAVLAIFTACSNTPKKSEAPATEQVETQDTIVYEHQYLVKVGDMAPDFTLKYTTGTSWSPAMAATRSMRNGSVTGFTLAAKITSTSTLATAGRMKWFFLGRIFSTMPFPFSTEISTMSPVNGVSCPRRRWPLPRQEITLLSVCTS